MQSELTDTITLAMLRYRVIYSSRL